MCHLCSCKGRHFYQYVLSYYPIFIQQRNWMIVQAIHFCALGKQNFASLSLDSVDYQWPVTNWCPALTVEPGLNSFNIKATIYPFNLMVRIIGAVSGYLNYFWENLRCAYFSLCIWNVSEAFDTITVSCHEYYYCHLWQFLHQPLRKKCPCSALFWSAFSCNNSEYGYLSRSEQYQ